MRTNDLREEGEGGRWRGGRWRGGRGGRGGENPGGAWGRRGDNPHRCIGVSSRSYYLDTTNLLIDRKRIIKRYILHIDLV